MVSVIHLTYQHAYSHHILSTRFHTHPINYSLNYILYPSPPPLTPPPPSLDPSLSGLRHLCVINKYNQVLGMITRADLVSAHMMKVNEGLGERYVLNVITYPHPSHVLQVFLSV